MSFSQDIRDAAQRYPQYLRQLKELFAKYSIGNAAALLGAFKVPAFREDFGAWLQSLAEHEGGKLSFATALALIGAALGGVGVAALGSAIGLPLLAIGGALGLFVGNELDSEGYTKAFLRKCKAFYNG